MSVLHVARQDLSPVRDRLSEYATGSYGPIMTASFMTLGAGAVVLGLAMLSTGTMTGWSRVVPLALVVAGCGLVVSGLFPTDPTGAPTTAERIHSLASGSASLAVITAAVVSTLLARRRRPRGPLGPVGVVACLALVFGAISPFVHGSRWTGLSQRLLWLTLMTWLFLTVWHLTSAGAEVHGAARALEALDHRDDTIERCS